MTTIHAYTQDQSLQDAPHKDLRRARAAAINLIPTSTGAAKAIGLVLPDLQGKVDGDLRARAGRRRARSPISSSRSAARRLPTRCRPRIATRPHGPLEGILQFSEDPLVSTDIIGNAYSCIYDSALTMVHGSTVKVFGWYDNEWGYSCRLVDLIGKLLP